MLRTIFGKKDPEEEQPESTTMASSITISDFKDALSRYPAVLKARNANAKPDATPIEELDKFRYVEAPARFSKNTGATMKLEDIQKLLQWKLRHGTFRPSLTQQVASNSDEKVEEATKDAFSHYASNPDDIKTVIEKLSAPLKGIGPATASLLLAVHDPDHVVFFSDELYTWLVADGKSVQPKYKIAEFEALFSEAKALQARLHVSPIDIEKAAFVLIKENEPIAEKKVPSGRGRGRPKLPEDQKKPKKEVVPGRGRGRPPKDGVAAKPKVVASGAKRGRPAKAAKTEEKEDAEEEAKTPASAKKRKAIDDGNDTPKKRGRKPKA
ncbi:hypothetical protein LAWI1_G004741 [Lachnellula willkommii]|uniref:Uncharacterized protein n=1 Tax=Lachnellula willkommii TaxID=215461 RepID=A0A559M318_9HELO|nr:hypothetical protein LAWI1_G004741 [Lachnellula willkommii]